MRDAVRKRINQELLKQRETLCTNPRYTPEHMRLLLILSGVDVTYLCTVPDNETSECLAIGITGTLEDQKRAIWARARADKNQTMEVGGGQKASGGVIWNDFLSKKVNEVTFENIGEDITVKDVAYTGAATLLTLLGIVLWRRVSPIGSISKAIDWMAGEETVNSLLDKNDIDSKYRKRLHERTSKRISLAELQGMSEADIQQLMDDMRFRDPKMRNRFYREIYLYEKAEEQEAFDDRNQFDNNVDDAVNILQSDEDFTTNTNNRRDVNVVADLMRDNTSIPLLLQKSGVLIGDVDEGNKNYITNLNDYQLERKIRRNVSKDEGFFGSYTDPTENFRKDEIKKVLTLKRIMKVLPSVKRRARELSRDDDYVTQSTPSPSLLPLMQSIAPLIAVTASVVFLFNMLSATFYQRMHLPFYGIGNAKFTHIMQDPEKYTDIGTDPDALSVNTYNAVGSSALRTYKQLDSGGGETGDLSIIDEEMHAIFEAETNVSKVRGQLLLLHRKRKTHADTRGYVDKNNERALLALHLFRPDGKPRSSPAEIALAIRHYTKQQMTTSRRLMTKVMGLFGRA